MIAFAYHLFYSLPTTYTFEKSVIDCLTDEILLFLKPSRVLFPGSGLVLQPANLN